MDAVEHVPGRGDFLIEEKDVSVTEFRRKPSAVWRYLETPGHVIFFTRRKKHIAVLMSVETHGHTFSDVPVSMKMPLQFKFIILMTMLTVRQSPFAFFRFPPS